MKGIAKKAAFITVATLAVAVACWFAYERILLLHQNGGASRFRMLLSLGFLVATLAALVLICAADMSRIFKGRAEKWMLQGAVAAGPVPELEEAERLRAAGRPLDAIGAIREYLQEHPYELHVMSRIAEIYRYDLNNDLAAALEYEELLKHKLPDDQWAWAALHLAKLYGRRNELDKSLELLERLNTEYGHTMAGRRAKKALEQVNNPQATEEDAEEAGEEG
jgi:tetratricopeptide (TPR) repeat protein